jgi:hypothetical protein
MESAKGAQNEIRIDRDALERDGARRAIGESGLPSLFSSIAPGAYGTTHVNLEILEGLEEFAALFTALTTRLDSALTRGEDPARERFINLYGLFVSASECEKRARASGSGAVSVKGTLDAARLGGLIGRKPGALLKEVLADYSRYITFYRDHKDPSKRLASDMDMANATAAYFRLLANTMEAAGAEPVFSSFMQDLEQRAVEATGARWRLFAPAGTPAADPMLLPMWPEDIVGNREYLEAALRLARDTAGFDFAAGRNPKRTNPVLFALGRPGCGKTATAHAVGNYFLRFCLERDVPAGFLVIRRTDWASSYQNASAQQLLNLFREKVEEAPGVMGVYWPDIDTAFAAREEPGVRNEERNILGALFGIFDGTLLPRNGKWFMLCDANYMQMDEAAVSRITQDPYYLKGVQTPGEYLALLRDRRLKDYLPYLLISHEEWDAVAERCVKYDFSGREIENISRKVISTIEDFEYPDEYFKASYEERLGIIRKLSRTIDAPALSEMLDAYWRFESEAQEKAYRKRFEDRVRDIALHLRAEAMARSEM